MSQLTLVTLMCGHIMPCCVVGARVQRYLPQNDQSSKGGCDLPCLRTPHLLQTTQGLHPGDFDHGAHYDQTHKGSVPPRVGLEHMVLACCTCWQKSCLNFGSIVPIYDNASLLEPLWPQALRCWMCFILWGNLFRKLFCNTIELNALWKSAYAQSLSTLSLV